MAKARKVIITCAVTGSIHTPSMSPHLPITASEIADAAIGAAEAGAAVVHLHARDPQDGRPDQSPEAFAPFLKVIKQRSSCVINITTGGAPTMRWRSACGPAATFKPEVASLNMGTMNFGLYPMLARQKEFKYDWEKPYLEGSRERMLQEHVRRHRVHPDDLRQQRHALRDRVLRHRPSLHAAPFRRPRRGQAAVLHPVGVRHPGRHRPASRGRAAHEAHGRPAVRRRVSLERAGRGAQPDADRGAGGGHGRQRARRHGGLAVDRPRPARQEQRRAGDARCARSSRAWGWRSPRRDEAREMLQLKGGDKVGF